MILPAAWLPDFARLQRRGLFFAALTCCYVEATMVIGTAESHDMRALSVSTRH